MPVTWCDKLASVPVVGFTLDWHFASAGALWEALTPTLDQQVVGDKPTFTINQNDPFAVSFQTESGFHYALEASKVVVSFQHRMRAKPVSGGPPVMEMLSHPQPFSDLLAEVSRRLVAVTLAVPATRNRRIHRVGIVANTMLSLSDTPPGVSRFIDYVGRPWGKSVEVFAFQIVSEIGKTQAWADRCIHNITKAEGDELVSLSFDWQRSFVSGQAINPGSLTKMLELAQTDASAYFEDLGEGGRFDENILSSTTA